MIDAANFAYTFDTNKENTDVFFFLKGQTHSGATVGRKG